MAENPLGVGGKALHRWAFTTRTFRRMFGQDGGDTGVDDRFAARGFENVGAWVMMGRNMFGPVRGPWPDESWTGWWGDTPPYHCPVFVLTHHPRRPLEMNGGTVFHFVTDGFAAALKNSKEAAHGKDVRVGGGVATIRQGLRAGLVACEVAKAARHVTGIDLTSAMNERVRGRQQSFGLANLTWVQDDAQLFRSRTRSSPGSSPGIRSTTSPSRRACSPRPFGSADRGVG